MKRLAALVQKVSLVQRSAFMALMVIGCAGGIPLVDKSAEKDRIPSIVQAGAVGLRSRAQEVDPATINTPAVQNLIGHMVEAMRKAPGVGLAAPQLGIPLRIIVLEDRAELATRLTPQELDERQRAPFALRVFINPELQIIGQERATFFEGCLSVQGYTALVERALDVEVTGLDAHGRPQHWRVRGWPARILQHELDHLNGTLYVDRMLTRSFMTVEHAKTLYSGKSSQELQQLLGR